MFLDNERTYNARSSLRNTIKTFATRRSTFCPTFFPYCRKDDIKKTESNKKI